VIGLRKTIIVLVVAMVMLCMALPAGAQVGSQQSLANNVLQVADSQGNLKTFTGLVDQAGLRDILSTREEYTIFAPTDDAFKKLNADQFNGLTSDKTKLQELLRHHVVKGRYTAKDLASKGSVQALDGSTLRVMSSDSAFSIDNAHIVKTDVSAGNGVIQVIDTVLVPK
jgi:uncharacterized surface protein with fasciclin (FAS1) repeats